MVNSFLSAPSALHAEFPQFTPDKDSILSPLDLSPAKWIWYPMGRCLPSTVVLFRREIALADLPIRATGTILADSRYKLTVNGQRIQWGPAPVDPRWMEADPVDLTAFLKIGENVIGCSVLFFGAGDGTWIMGNPGFLFRLDLEWSGGRREQIVSDARWQAQLARSWPAGHYKRWFLRAFQEQFDARLYPFGWDRPGFVADENWLVAAVTSDQANLPSVCTRMSLNTGNINPESGENFSIRRRSVPMLNEPVITGFDLQEGGWITWTRTAEEYFDFETPDAFTAEWGEPARKVGAGCWEVPVNGEKSASLTFAHAEQMVGWPCFTVDAPAGTIVEILVHEAHKPGGPFIINSHFSSWTRFICREGENDFETFDFESYRWIQFIVRNHTRPVVLKNIAIRRRIYPWPQSPEIHCSDTVLQRLFDASVNTLHNAAQDTAVDGMARERQQYSGDGGHLLHPIFHAFGEERLPARFVNTFSQGITPYGYFMDAWPAFDRLARIVERQLQMSEWGPILDHGVGFIFDCYHYHLYSGKLDALKEAFPRLLRFFRYLETIRDDDGLLKVTDLGVPMVWIDHDAYKQKRHRQCAFNLYVAAACRHALLPLCKAFDAMDWVEEIETFAGGLEKACVAKFWDVAKRVFICNLPWRGEEGETRMCDRSLATSVIFDQCPEGASEEALRVLAAGPPELGISYPCNAVWRYWALAKGRAIQVVIDELRRRWGTMKSVLENNTLQETWECQHDSGSQWSHAPMAPLIVLYQGLVGLKPLSPGYEKCVLFPQLGDLEQLSVHAHTVKGTVQFAAKRAGKTWELILQLPPGMEGEIILRSTETVVLSRGRELAPDGYTAYALPRSEEVTLRLMEL